MSRTIRFSDFAVLAAALLIGLAITIGTASAGPLDDLRANGVLGERYDGLVAVHDASRADDSAKSVMTDINAKRRAYYEQIAAKENASVEDIAKIYAKTLYEKSPSGYWFLGQDGTWRQKQ